MYLIFSESGFMMIVKGGQDMAEVHDTQGMLLQNLVAVSYTHLIFPDVQQPFLPITAKVFDKICSIDRGRNERKVTVASTASEYPLADF